MPPKRPSASASPASASSSALSQSTPSKKSTTTTTTTTITSTTTTTSSRKAEPPPQTASQIVQHLISRYDADTPQRVKLIDAFMGFLVVLGLVQFVYCVLFGNYPFNAFLAGFSATVGQFILTASLRIQTNPANKAEFRGGLGGGGDERAFADYVFGSLLLHVICVNFIN